MEDYLALVRVCGDAVADKVNLFSTCTAIALIWLTVLTCYLILDRLRK